MPQNALRQNTIFKAMVFFSDRPDINLWYKSWSHRPANVGTWKKYDKVEGKYFHKKELNSVVGMLKSNGRSTGVNWEVNYGKQLG